MSIEESINPIEESELFQALLEEKGPMRKKNALKKWVSAIIRLYTAMPLILKEQYRQQCITAYNFDVHEFLNIPKPDQTKYLDKFKTTIIRKKQNID